MENNFLTSNLKKEKFFNFWDQILVKKLRENVE